MPEKSCPEGGMIKTEEFNPKHCSEVKVASCCSQKKFESCVRGKLIMEIGKCEPYNLSYFCITWTNSVINECRAEACKK